MNWINLGALDWAFEYDVDSAAQRIVLVEFAYHSDERGYTWPSALGIASKWHLDRKTVAGAIDELLVRHAFSDTKKRRGKTRQIKVYRMPKITWGRYSQTDAFKKGQGVQKMSAKCPESGCQTDTNKEKGTRNNQEKRAGGNSEPSLGNGPLASTLSSILSSVSPAPKAPSSEPEPPWREEARQLYPGTDVDKDVKRIEEWARKKKGIEPTRALVRNALKKNPPQKIGERKRGPKIDIEAAMAASIAKGEAENRN